MKTTAVNKKYNVNYLLDNSKCNTYKNKVRNKGTHTMYKLKKFIQVKIQIGMNLLRIYDRTLLKS